MRHSADVRSWRGDAAKPGWFARTVILVSLTLAAQPIELGTDADASGLAWLIRLAFFSAFAGCLALASRQLPSSNHVALAVAVSTPFVAINVLHAGPFTVIALTGILLGIAAAYYSEFGVRDTMIWAVTRCIQLHILSLMLSYALLLATGRFVDLHNFIFPFSFSRQGSYLNFDRLSGFFIEPGTYSQWVYMLTLLRLMLTGRGFDRLSFFAMLSCLLTLSAWSAVLVPFFLLAFLMSTLDTSRTPYRLQMTVVMGFGAALASAAAAYLLFTDEVSTYVAYIHLRYTGATVDSSTQIRMDSFRELMNRFSEVIVFGNPMSDPVCRWCVASEDLGLWSSLIYYLGLFPTTVLALALAAGLLARGGLPLLAAAVPLALTKAQFYEPLAWLILTVGLGLRGAPARASSEGRRFGQPDPLPRRVTQTASP